MFFFFFILISFKLKLACIKLVGECNLSFNIIQNKVFRELIELIAGRTVTIPSTTDIMNTLTEHFETMKLNLINKLAKQKYLCLTTDVWSSRAQSYFGMTVHYIDSDFKRESFLLAFRQLPKKQTNVEITKMIRQILREFKIDPKKVTHIVTDGGDLPSAKLSNYTEEVLIL